MLHENGSPLWPGHLPQPRRCWAWASGQWWWIVLVNGKKLGYNQQQQGCDADDDVKPGWEWRVMAHGGWFQIAPNSSQVFGLVPPWPIVVLAAYVHPQWRPRNEPQQLLTQWLLTGQPTCSGWMFARFLAVDPDPSAIMTLFGLLLLIIVNWL